MPSKRAWLIVAAVVSLLVTAVAGYFYWDAVVLGLLAVLVWVKKLGTLKGLLLVAKKLPLLLLLGLKRIVIRITSRFLLFTAHLRFRPLRRWMGHLRSRARQVKRLLKYHWNELEPHEQLLVTVAALPLTLVLLGLILFLFLPKAMVSFVIVKLKEHSSAAVLHRAVELGAREKLREAEAATKNRIRRMLSRKEDEVGENLPGILQVGRSAVVMNYHIIGDIHGQAEKLEALLSRLGYRKRGGIYRQPGAMAVFLGDFIDRGPHQRRVIDIVRGMTEQGQAMAVMGNHEFNAIGYHLQHPETGDSLRPRNEKNTRQHEAFLAEYGLHEPETGEVIDWFRRLPLHLEARDANGRTLFRVVHACWSQPVVDRMPALLGDELLLEAHREGTQAFRDVEVLLKGPEIPLPDGSSFLDKDGNERRSIRIKWWETTPGITWREIAMVPEEELTKLPDSPVPGTLLGGYRYIPAEPPVFFGHYWLTGEPAPIRENLACLDYSAGKEGELVAYCWHEGDQGRPLDPGGFIRA